MIQIFGDYVEADGERQEYLKIGFSPSSVPLQQRWRNNGLSADFLADYLVTFFPRENGHSHDRQIEIRGAVSFIANELLENAMKFNYSQSHHAVSIHMNLDQDKVRFYVTNCVHPQKLEKFQCFIRKLLSEEPEELYIEQLMSNTESDTKEDSGLGYLTMLNDYDVQLAWKFTSVEENPKLMQVTTFVEITV